MIAAAALQLMVSAAAPHDPMRTLRPQMSLTELHRDFGVRLHPGMSPRSFVIDNYVEGGELFDAEVILGSDNRVAMVELAASGERKCRRLAHRLFVRLGPNVMAKDLNGDHGLYQWHDLHHGIFVTYRDMWGVGKKPLYNCTVQESLRPPKR